MRLIVDRQQMIDQALSGFGRVGNDLYSPFDPDYLGDELPQRHQDVDQARSLLRAAGYADSLQVELTTSTAVGTFPSTSTTSPASNARSCAGLVGFVSRARPSARTRASSS